MKRAISTLFLNSSIDRQVAFWTNQWLDWNLVEIGGDHTSSLSLHMFVILLQVCLLRTLCYAFSRRVGNDLAGSIEWSKISPSRAGWVHKSVGEEVIDMWSVTRSERFPSVSIRIITTWLAKIVYLQVISVYRIVFSFPVLSEVLTPCNMVILFFLIKASLILPLSILLIVEVKNIVSNMAILFAVKFVYVFSGL